MDNKFYNDHFEQFLKETVDDFRMYPSKRIWNSLYNNLHPGRKWPSVATCLLIMLTIVLFGISHQNVITAEKNDEIKPGNFIAFNSSAAGQVDQPTVLQKKTTSVLPDNIQTAVDHNPSADLTSTIATVVNHNSSNPINSSSQHFNASHRTVTNDIKSGIKNTSNINITEASEQVMLDVTATQKTEIDNITANNYRYTSYTSENNTGILTIQFNEYSPLTISTKEPFVTRPLVRKRSISLTDKEWIEDFAFHNKPKSKWKGRLSHQWYVTPSIGYRTMSKNVNTDAFTSSFTSPPSASRSQVYTFSHAPSWNLEAGTAFLLSVSKSVRLKAGLQLNYTRYKVNGAEMEHPGYTTILLRNSSTGLPEFTSRSSTIANIPVGTKGDNLNSSTYQISIPLGADIKLAGTDRLKWHIGASIQPTYVIGGNPYLISADMKNYVYDASLLRRLNFNTSFETFVSFELKNNMVLNAGLNSGISYFLLITVVMYMMKSYITLELK